MQTNLLVHYLETTPNMDIHFQQVSKLYPNNHLGLDNVSFSMASGEFAFLTGHSGAGKSTLLKLISGLEFTTHGHVIVGDQDMSKLKTKHIPAFRRRIGLILQTPKLLVDRTVFDNAALPLIIAGRPYHEIQNRVHAVFMRIGLQHKEKCYPYELSTGEQQRVAIARAIINKPQLLLADEPTGNLDPELAAEIMHLFEQFSRLGTTILIASHDIALVKKLGRRVLKLGEGKLLCS